jgi:prepilin peptidase CpaA
MTPATYSLVEWLAAATALLACVTDVRSRRIPNVLTFGAALVALAVHFALRGPGAVAWGAIGWLLGLLLFLPVFALRGLGGGDVKLLAAFGAFVGPRLVIWTALYGAIAGGVFAVFVALSHGVLARTVGHMRLMLTHWRVAGIGPVDGLTLDTSTSPRLPYALPLACGLLVALWLEA